MTFKVGDTIIVQDWSDTEPKIAKILRVTDSGIETNQGFYFHDEVRKLTKLELALR